MKGKHYKYPPPLEIIARELIDDLEVPLDQLRLIDGDLGGGREPNES